MSFLLDPPMLVATGAAIEVVAPNERAARVMETGVIALYWGVSGALYADAPRLERIWRPFGSSGGRDFMVNSGVFRFDTSRAGVRSHVAALAILATYPVFLRIGRRLGRRLRPSGTPP